MPEFFCDIVSVIESLDAHLVQALDLYGGWVYAILFLVILLETTVLFGALLPGDTLAVGCGVLAAAGYLNPWMAVGVLASATILGYFMNYAIGIAVAVWYGARKAGQSGGRLARFRARPSVVAVERFFVRHARATVFFARFIPFMRSMVPLAAGLGKMARRPFFIVSAAGGLLWSGTYFSLGYAVTDLAVLSGRLWLVPFGIAALFAPAWLVNKYFTARVSKREN